MQRKKKIVIFILLGLLIALLWLAFRKSNEQSDKASPASPTQNQTSGNLLPLQPQPASRAAQNDGAPAPAQQKRFTAAFLTPIAFYGKVIDQNGEPVPDANVRMAAVDKPWGEPSVYSKKTDQEGLFSISGIVGLDLSVSISKSGYRVIPPADDKVTSSGLFEYGLSSIKGPHQPEKSAPVIFTLYKYGQLEPLAKVGKKNFRIARNGSPLAIALDPAHQVVLRCWNTELSRPTGQRQYDWKLEISATNGGVIARKDDFLFEAPETGYQPSETINMPASLPLGQWHDSAKRSYFVRFNDNTFARVNLEMQAGGDHFVVWESFLNPKVSSRNLEYDPAKVVKSQ